MGKLRDKIVGVQPVILHRNEPVHPPLNYPWVTLSYQPDIQQEEAPRPVPASSFAGIGRDPAHSPTPIKRFQTLAISDWLSVMGWPFALRTVPQALTVSMPNGKFNPIRERSTISMPEQTTLSDLVTVDAQPITTQSLLKISG